jgi:hypothetical protein
LNFNDFAEHTRNALTQLITNMHGDREPSTMVIMQTPDEDVRMVGVDPEFFNPEFPERRRELVGKFVVPMIGEHEATMVAVTYPGWLYHDTPDDVLPESIVSITVIDREVHRTWYAPLVRDPQPLPGSDQFYTVGLWESWPANKQSGLFVTPIQKAMR